MKILLGNFRYDQKPFSGHGAWLLPDRCFGSVDLTPPAVTREAVKGQPYGSVICVVQEIPRGWDGAVLGSEHPGEARPDAIVLDAWESITGYRPGGDTIADMVYDHFINGSDPQGDAACHPLVPTAEQNVELWLHGLHKRERFRWGRHRLTNKLQALLQRSMGQVLDAELPEAVHQKVLGGLCLKYGLKGDDWKLLVPKRLHKHIAGPLHPESTVSDDFNRGNSTGLGTASGGGTYTLLEGPAAADVASAAATNHVIGDTLLATMRLDVNLSSSDNYAEISIVQAGVSGGSGVCARTLGSGTVTGYMGYWLETPNVGLYKCSDYSTTAFTQIGSNVGVTTSLPDTLRNGASGSTITVDYNGVNKISQTDSTYSTGLRVAFRIGPETGDHKHILDDFSGTDFVFASPSVAPATATIDQGDTVQLTASDFTGTDVDWDSDDVTICNVDSGGEVTGEAHGFATAQVATITATGQDVPAETDTCAVTVNPVVVTVTPATTAIAPGATVDIDAVVTGTIIDTTVTWSVQSGGGSVDASGVFTAPGLPDICVVRATSDADSARYDECIVTVSPVRTVEVGADPGPGFSGLEDDIGLTIFNDDGTVYAARTTGDLAEDGVTGQYEFEVPLPKSNGYFIVIDMPEETGLPPFVEVIQPERSGTTYVHLFCAPYGPDYTGETIGITFKNLPGLTTTPAPGAAHTTSGVFELADWGIYGFRGTFDNDDTYKADWDAPSGRDPFVERNPQVQTFATGTGANRGLLASGLGSLG